MALAEAAGISKLSLLPKSAAPVGNPALDNESKREFPQLVDKAATSARRARVEIRIMRLWKIKMNARRLHPQRVLALAAIRPRGKLKKPNPRIFLETYLENQRLVNSRKCQIVNSLQP
jgi:hypothetical protein